VLSRDAPPPALNAIELLRHRGPDGEGRRSFERCAFAMRRLAIIDLETGDQPVENETGDVVAIVNGEIYNYRELRADLGARGHTFRGEGDVEVVPHLYEELGWRCFEKLRGMFAVALYDARRDDLVLARDRFGIKPLYVANTPDGFAFASEIKPLLALGASDEVDPQAVADYLALGYVPGGATGLRSVHKLAPGHAWVEGEERSYWSFEPNADRAGIEETLAEAVRLHLRSDVPLAVLLSGGLDSSLIAALAAAELDEPLRTFSVGFADAELDERPHARVVADAIGSRHRELVVETNVAEDLPEIAARLEQPLADVAAIPLWYLCRAVASEVKVALAGDGGDEVFGGYSRYAWDPRAARVGRVLPRALLERIPELDGGRKALGRRASKLLRHAPKSEAARYLAWFSVLSDELRAEVLTRPADPPERAFEKLLEEAPQSLTPLGRLQYVDLYSFLADNLMLKADKLSMAHSLELRVPFLDHRVVEAGLGLHDRDKVRGVRTKVAIRRLVERRFGRALAQRPKQGFDAPIDRWLRGELRDLAGDAIDTLDGIVDSAAAKRVLDKHSAGEADGGQPLYALLMLSLWRAGLRHPRWTPVT
jgi:asparagine synthase (glutamine-hydrolysing)